MSFSNTKSYKCVQEFITMAYISLVFSTMLFQ